VILTEGDPSIGRKTCCIFTLSTINLTGKPVFGDERPKTARTSVRPQTVDKEQKPTLHC
jgi:hypothetical protein